MDIYDIGYCAVTVRESSLVLEKMLDRMMRQCTLNSTKQMAPFFLSCAAYDPFSRFLPSWQSHDSEQFRRNGVICLNSSCTRM